MAVVIRLRQQGKTNRRSFRLVATDVKGPRDGKYLEKLGWYDPHIAGDDSVILLPERIEYWLEKGAILSDKAKALVKRKAPEVIKKFQEKKTNVKK